VSLALLFKDELNGFYRSKVMIALWIGLPALALLLFYAVPSSTSGLSVAAFASVIVSVIGGTISSVMLAVTIINEKERKVYDLFFIRPIHRWELVIAKFLAVLLCVVVAGMLAVLIGLGLDTARLGTLPPAIGETIANSLLITIGMIGITTSASALIGIASPSVLVGVIAVLYGSNQVAGVVILPYLTAGFSPLVSFAVAMVVTAVMLAIACVYFERKQM